MANKYLLTYLQVDANTMEGGGRGVKSWCQFDAMPEVAKYGWFSLAISNTVILHVDYHKESD